MEKPTKRKAFNFLRSYFDVVNELDNDADKLSFLMAVINKQFLDEDPKEMSFLVKLCYSSQKHAIESSVKGWKRVTNTDMEGNPILNPSTNPPTNPMTNPPTNPIQEEVKVEEKVKVKEKEKENNSIDSRKLKFANTLKDFVEIYGRDLIKEFYDYWTEPNKSNTKFRQELEKTWDLERRLNNWAKNDKNFKKIENGQFNNSGSNSNSGYKPATVDREKLIQELTDDVANGNIPGVY